MIYISIGAHIINRLKQVGIDTVFGVPGDSSMPLLNLIEDDAELIWANNVSNLTAAYAADGYARVRGMGAIVTTFGVGELSAINGIAGAYSERIPVIHIVASPQTTAKENGALLYETPKNSDDDVFYKISAMVAIASTKLTLENALSEIDRVIETVFINKRPGYINIPTNLINVLIETPSVVAPLQLSLPKSSEQIQSTVINQALRAIAEAKHPLIIVDNTVHRYGLIDEVNAFVKQSGFPTLSTMGGKGIVDESLSNYRGIYNGSFTYKGVKDEINDTDLLIEVGSVKSDLNTGNFSYGFDDIKTITLDISSATINHTEYVCVGMHELLPLLTSALPAIYNPIMFRPRVKPDLIDTSINDITHNYLWNKLSEYLTPKSVIVSETGSAGFGVSSVNSIKGAIYINQLLWASIGYSIGAAVGAAFADRSRKVYLFVGDGSFQLTFQEISVFIRQGLTPVIFLLNNDGYLTEKLIHGNQRKYNNFQMWDYSKTLGYFGGHLEINRIDNGKPSDIGLETKVTTRQEFEDAMKTVGEQPDKIHFLEVVMPEFDTPFELSQYCVTSENR